MPRSRVVENRRTGIVRHVTLATVVALGSWAVVLTAQEQVTLNLDLFKNGRLVSAHTVSLAVGKTASLLGLAERGLGRIAFTPTKRTPDQVWLAFDIDVGRTTTEPSLRLSTEPSAITWSAANGSDSFELRVALVR